LFGEVWPACFDIGRDLEVGGASSGHLEPDLPLPLGHQPVVFGKRLLLISEVIVMTLHPSHHDQPSLGV